MFGASIGLMTGFTFIFPVLGIITLPTAVLTVYSIFIGDITFVDDSNLIEDGVLTQEEE